MALIISAPRDLIRGFLLPEKHIYSTAHLVSERNFQLMNTLSDSSSNMAEILALVKLSGEICQYIHQLRQDLSSELSYEEDTAVDAMGNVDLSEVGYVENKTLAFKRIAETDKFRLFHQPDSFREEAFRLTDNKALEEYINMNLQFESTTGKNDSREAWSQYYFTGPFLQSAAVLSMFEASVQMIVYELINEFTLITLHDPDCSN